MTICFYSGTGNSYFITKCICNNFENVKVISISQNYNRYITIQDEEVGIIFPVHGKGMPPIVFEFLQNTRFIGTQYFFVIANYGGISGKIIEMTDAIFRYNSINLNYIKKIRMPANCVIAYPVFRPSLDQIMRVGKKVNRICRDIEIRKTNNLHSTSNKKGFDNLTDFMVHKKRIYAERGALFYANEKCVRCLSCIRLCPVSNIEINEYGITFNIRCIQCMACINWCPRKAINWNHKTEKRDRYVNPAVAYSELINANKIV